jgi:3-phenylpropionate/trans-cinnamate dioxygenase ferredoxin subunit
MRVAVGRVDDFEEPAIRLMAVAGRNVGVIRWKDDFFAVLNTCPHMAGPVCGFIKKHIGWSGVIGTPVVFEDRPIIVCGWHHWEFDLLTGRALLDPKSRLRTYPIEVAEGQVIVDVPAPRASTVILGTSSDPEVGSEVAPD